jgi:hypothetical protein
MITQVAMSSKAGIYPKVVVSGKHIHVSKGELRMGSTSFTLTEDEEFEALDRPDPTCFMGYIVRLKGGEIRLFVDEVSSTDPVFDFSGNGIERLQMLFSLETLPGVPGFVSGRVKQNAHEEVSSGA